MKRTSIKSTTKLSPYPSPNQNNSMNKSLSSSPNILSNPIHNHQTSHSPNAFAQSLSASNFLNQSPNTFKTKISQILMDNDKNLITSSKNLQTSLRNVDFMNMTDPSTTRNIHAVQIGKEFTPRDMTKTQQSTQKVSPHNRSIPSPSAKLLPFQRITTSHNNSKNPKSSKKTKNEKETKSMRKSRKQQISKQKRSKLSNNTSIVSPNPNETSISSAKAMLSQLQQLSSKTFGFSPASNSVSDLNLNYDLTKENRLTKPKVFPKSQHQRKNNKVFYSQLSPQPSLQRTIKRSSSSSKSKKVAVRNNSLTSTTKKKKGNQQQYQCQQTKHHHTQPVVPQINLGRSRFMNSLNSNYQQRIAQSAYHAYAPLADLTNNSAIDMDYSLQRPEYDDDRFNNTKFWPRNLDFQNTTQTDLSNSLFQYRCPSGRQNKFSTSRQIDQGQILSLSNKNTKSFISPNFRLQTASSKKLEQPFHTSASHRLDSNRSSRSMFNSYQLTLDEILTGLGISSYKSQFKKQSIELEDFFLLTRQDLKQLGLPISARNRVLAFLSFFSKSSNKNVDLSQLNGEKSLLEAILKENFSDKLVSIITSSSVSKSTCNNMKNVPVKSQRTPYKQNSVRGSSSNQVQQQMKYNFTQYKKLYAKSDQQDLRPLNAPPQQESIQDLRGQLQSPQNILFKQQQQPRCSNGLDQFNSQTLDLSQYSQKGINRSKRNLIVPDRILETQERQEESINHHHHHHLQQQDNFLINEIESQYNLTSRSKISDQGKELQEMTADFRKKGSLSPTGYQQMCLNIAQQNKMSDECSNTFTTGVSTNRSNGCISSMRLNYRQQQQQHQQLTNTLKNSFYTIQPQLNQSSNQSISNISQVINQNTRSVNLTPQPATASSDQKSSSSMYKENNNEDLNIDIQQFMSRNPQLQQIFKKQQSKSATKNQIFKKNKYFNFGNKHLSSKYNRMSTSKRKMASTSSENLNPSPNSSFISKISRVSTPTTTVNCTMFNSNSALKPKVSAFNQSSSTDDLNTSLQMRNKLKKDRNQMNLEVKEIMAELQALSKPNNDKKKRII